MEIQLAENVWHVFSCLIVFTLGALIAHRLAKPFRISQRKALFIYLWHTIFCCVYLLFSLSNVADSISYYRESLTFHEFSFGTGFLILFSSVFTKYMGLSYIGLFLVFNIIGFIGLLAFYGALNSIVKNKTIGVRRMALIVVLLPSVSFWSSAIGKDAVAFLSIGLALWASLNLRKHIFLMVIAVLLMLPVRPHIAGIMIVSLSIAMLFDKNVNILGKLVLGVLAISAASIMVPFAIKYAGLVDLSQLAEYIHKRQSYNQDGGSSIDISSMSLPMQLFTYAFRPLPFEAHSLTALLSSIDNLYLLVLFLVAVFASLVRKRAFSNANLPFLISYLGASWIALAVTTSNLGIAVRQKWMFLPILIFLCFMYIGSPAREKAKE